MLGLPVMQREKSNNNGLIWSDACPDIPQTLVTRQKNHGPAAHFANPNRALWPQAWLDAVNPQVSSKLPKSGLSGTKQSNMASLQQQCRRHGTVMKACRDGLCKMQHAEVAYARCSMQRWLLQDAVCRGGFCKMQRSLSLRLMLPWQTWLADQAQRCALPPARQQDTVLASLLFTSHTHVRVPTALTCCCRRGQRT